MSWTNSRQVMMVCCAAAAVLAAPGQSRADCPLTDWLFGHGQTTYAPPYCPPGASAPASPACGCAPAQCVPVQPSCQPCMPTATYRISYRPVPTVAYMPVVATDPCSGCAVTTYRPVRSWTYQASLQPYATYQVGYAPAIVGVGSCGSCGGCAPCSGYSTGGCSSCGVSYGGCSSCGAGGYGGYVTSGGCSSCVSSSAPLPAMTLPGPGDMSRPPAASSMSVAPPGSTTLGPPVAAPMTTGDSLERAKTYAPGATSAPLAPGAPGGASSSGGSYRGPTSTDGSGSAEPVKIQGIPPVPSGSQLSTPQGTHTESENRTTSQPVNRAKYFQLLPSPPPAVPAQLISAPARSAPRVDDSGWKHVDN